MRTVSLLALVVLASASLARAEEVPPQSSVVAEDEVPWQKPTPKRLSIGLGFSWFDYAEDVPAPLKSTETGLYKTINVAYRVESSPQSSFLDLGFGYGFSTMAYDGSTQDGDPATGSTPSNILHLRGVYGIPLSSSLRPYAGLGYHFWQRGSGYYSGSGPVSFREDYSWFFVPVGIAWQTTLGPRWSIGLDGSANFMFAGNMTLRLDQTVSNVDGNPDAHLGNRIGWRIEAPVSHELGPEVGLTLTPWYEKSSIGESPTFNILSQGEVVAAGHEPASRTYQYGLNTAISLKF